MRVLIACEFSATVRDAFRALGHDAYSCDLMPTIGKPAYHITGDVLGALRDGWDLMIAHPPCTYLAASGLHWNKRIEGRQAKTEAALAFVQKLMDAPIKKIAIENPVGCIGTRIRKADQIIQPWQFGHPESKATCLWLSGLDPLRPTKVLKRPTDGRWENQTPSGQNNLSQTKDRWKIRSVTYKGIAEAMAKQWGGVVGP